MFLNKIIQLILSRTSVMMLLTETKSHEVYSNPLVFLWLFCFATNLRVSLCNAILSPN